MRIQNLRAPHELPATQSTVGPDIAPAPRLADDGADGPPEQQNLEIAFLKARIQHLELVLETARNLMGANHERLLRRLHELPRELVELGTQLRRPDLRSTW